MKTETTEIKFHRFQNKTHRNKISFFVSFIFILALFLNVTSTPQAFAKSISNQKKNQAAKSDVKEKDKTQDVKVKAQDVKVVDPKKKTDFKKIVQTQTTTPKIKTQSLQMSVAPNPIDENGNHHGGGPRNDVPECPPEWDCSYLDTDCTEGRCHRFPGPLPGWQDYYECISHHINEGLACTDDHNVCDGHEICRSGACAHENPVICPPVTEECMWNVCNSGTGVCSLTPVDEGTLCLDGQPNPACSEDACLGGSCVNGGFQHACPDPPPCTPPDGPPLGCDLPHENCVIGGVWAGCGSSVHPRGCFPIYDQNCIRMVIADKQLTEICHDNYAVEWRDCSAANPPSNINAYPTVAMAVNIGLSHVGPPQERHIALFIREGIYTESVTLDTPHYPENTPLTIQPYNHEFVLLRAPENSQNIFHFIHGIPDGSSNITLQDLHFEGGGIKVHYDVFPYDHLSFINLHFSNLSSSGETLAIDLDRGANVGMKDIEAVGAGIRITHSNDVNLQHVRVYDYSAGDGIAIDPLSQHVTITDSTATQNSGTGFNVGSRTNFLKGNTAWANRLNGFTFAQGDSYANRLLSAQNGGYGIQLMVGSDNLIPTRLSLRQSTIADNNLTGIQMTGVPNPHLIPNLAELSLQNTIAMTAFDQPTSLALNIPADISPDQRYLFIDKGSNILRNREGDNSPIPAINLHGVDYENDRINRNEVPGLNVTTNALDPMMYQLPGEPRYHPVSGSPAIDTGTFAMFTNQAGDNTRTISVDGEPRYLFLPGDNLEVQNAGYGVIQNMAPNTIRILSSNQPLSYMEGMGVDNPWMGIAPDRGFYEFQHDRSACPGDLNDDGMVNVQDLSLLLATFGINNGGDCDGDGDTDIHDMSILFSHFGESC